jgi:hypothetical protein
VNHAKVNDSGLTGEEYEARVACDQPERMLNFGTAKVDELLKDISVTDSKQDEGFKVVDRRLFTEDGELRKDAGEQDRRWEEDAAKKAAPATAPRPAAGSTSAPAGSPAPGAIAPPVEEEAPAGETIESSRSFQMLVDFLTRNAAAMLGGMADPRTGQAFLDLEGAREVIDMLDALREKTLGNLAKADEDLLIEVLGSLKLTFMEISKAAAEQMKKQAGVKK